MFGFFKNKKQDILDLNKKISEINIKINNDVFTLYGFSKKEQDVILDVLNSY